MCYVGILLYDELRWENYRNGLNVSNYSLSRVFSNIVFKYFVCFLVIYIVNLVKNFLFVFLFCKKNKKKMLIKDIKKMLYNYNIFIYIMEVIG